MSGKPHEMVFLKDYQPPGFLVEQVRLTFDLVDEATVVTSELALTRNPARKDRPPLVLLGRQLTLLEVVLDGVALAEGEYQRDEETLTIPNAPNRCTVRCVTRINPAANTSLEGLYLSNGKFYTQCEAEGFRKITYYPDRPDVLARFTTTLIGDRARHPVMLSNGNPVARGEREDGRHFVTWEDPFPKPSYLFALVAGDLAVQKDTFTTASGRQVAIELYVEHENLDQCGHAIAALKKAMAWDEERFGREYDLDIYMIVAVSDFNMGAMENKGLNVFNAKYVLAKPETATDADYEAIESVIAHEYFHNWTGNRVTCRDWFQLSLKEGLTVFRDQEFSADQISPAVQRIHDVRTLRSFQFPEDAGPTAHPVRPDRYMEINNFYTVTVYNKGAEVVRMIHNLLGREGFRRGMDLYFQRHDGQAVTVEDFVAAMADANGFDFSRFMGWYRQAGTPLLQVSHHHDPETATYRLTIHQSGPPTPDQPEKTPFHIPVAMGLVDRNGEPVPLRLAGEAAAVGTQRVLELTEPEHSFVFQDVPSPPLPSLLRNFSAPVKLDLPLSDADLAFLWAHDADPFNRWEAGQTLAARVLLECIDKEQQGEPWQLPPEFIRAYATTLADEALEPALTTQALTLPAEGYLMELAGDNVDPGAIHRVRQGVRRQLGARLAESLLAVYHRHAVAGPYRYAPELAGQRALRNFCLATLLMGEAEASRQLALAQYQAADNMTDRLGALTPLAHGGGAEAEAALAGFHDTWQGYPLVMDKWFSVQATAPLPDALERVQRLMTHPLFTMGNPNRVRALVGAFASGNPNAFHDPSGAGYLFLADRILELDPNNPQLAARMLGAMTRWRKLEPVRRERMRTQLERVAKQPNLSRDTYEIASKSLNAAV